MAHILKLTDLLFDASVLQRGTEIELLLSSNDPRQFT